MKYDFETLLDRSHCGSGKWDEMKKKNPQVGPDVVPLSVADMEFKNAPEIAAGLKEYMDTHILGYTGPTDEYRAAVCQWMEKRHHWHIEPEWICCTHGVVAALVMAVAAYTQPGDGVSNMTPVYYPCYMAIESNGCQAARCPLVYQDHAYSIDFALLETLAQDPKNKMLILCSPHNPVGRVWTPEELARVCDICRENQVRILSDEIHFDIIMPGHSHTVISNAAQPGDDIIVCTAPSKTFNLAAMQTSNIIIPNANHRERFQAVQQKFCDHGPAALGLEACRVAYTQCEAWMEEMLQVIDANRQLAVDFINQRLPEIKPVELQGTYLLWLDCTALCKTQEELEELMVQKAQLFLDEGYVFGPEGAGFERVNLAAPRRVIQAALERLEKAVRGN